MSLIEATMTDDPNATLIAAMQRRLLEMEHEHAALQEELERMRKRLGEQRRNAGQLIERHEQERRGIATRLHEEAAQAMAAALLTVGLLERGVDEEMSRPQLEEVRCQVKACIADLRRIASSLRPAALDELGLKMALERFADVEAERGSRSLTFSLDALEGRLAPEVETATYRVIEELLDALPDAASVVVSLTAKRQRVQIVLEAWPSAEAVEPPEVHVDVVITRARVELIGGSLQVSAISGGGKRILAEIPTSREHR
jgi:signal transduction histidine kinase